MMSKEHNIIINGESVPVVIRKHKTARRMIIRYQPLARIISLTLPRYVSIRQGLHFVEEKRQWIAKEIGRHEKQKKFQSGQQIPLLGTPYELRHVGGRGPVRLSHNPFPVQVMPNNVSVFEINGTQEQDKKIIFMPGREEFIERRTRDWLKKLAHETISALVYEKTNILDVHISKMSIRDTSSHWGSCNAKGRISFSWRLVMAPYDVLDYVVCHEVCHLLEMNHSDTFWQHVETLCPEWKRHKDWLSAFGTQLYAFA